MKLIVGLGNPGREYAMTRHNVGFRVLDAIAGRIGTAFDRSKFKGDYAEGACSGPKGLERLLLVKPQTYMNLSGETVTSFKGYWKIDLPDVLVISDDVSLPVGALRIRRGGSDGGHNGLKSITQMLGSQDYARLRVGVGGREHGSERQPADLAGHVLSRFSKEEEELLAKGMLRAAEACMEWIGSGVEAAMNKFNTEAKQKSTDPRTAQSAGAGGHRRQDQ